MKHPAPTAQQYAVAMAYGNSAGTPKVVAKGRGLIAQAIIERARQHGIYVHESEDLIGLLMQVELDQQIPPRLYLAVAELLAWLYRLEHVDRTAIPPFIKK
ncbi:MAG: Type III secretion exporter [Candidatus Gallionella acididurans]|uniref:Type III secretion exporter n=1 Tax=Candidatus Gallionella acididurans TaxID=1796491 RepID=A0A139BXQ6_9PROT|nr:MAG: Type III secretion exporter [Candidatus Gallionella acididurans]